MVSLPGVRRGDVVRRLPLFALGAFVLAAVLTSVLAWTTYRSVGDVPGPILSGGWLDPWSRGDSGWFKAIAAQGYSYTPGHQSTVAFFPAYPLLVHAVGLLLGGNYSVAAGLVTLVCAGGAVALFAGWVRSRLEPRAAVVAVALLLVYPFSVYLYGSGYSDALFLLSALGAFALLERRHYVLAGIVGVLATAGRPVGIAVTIGLIVRAVELLAEDRAARAGESGRSVPVPLRELLRSIRLARWREAALLVSGAGLVAWMVYLYARFGDPLAFLTVQGAPGWNQGAGPHTWFKVAFFGTIYHGIWGNIVRLVPQALACVAALLLLPTAWRRFGWGYAAFSLVSIAIPLIGTKDFMGTGRYVLAAFPLLAAAAVVLTRERRPRALAVGVLAILVAGLGIAAVAFVSGVQIS
jgi:hypothetical protein